MFNYLKKEFPIVGRLIEKVVIIDWFSQRTNNTFLLSAETRINFLHPNNLFAFDNHPLRWTIKWGKASRFVTTSGRGWCGGKEKWAKRCSWMEGLDKASFLVTCGRGWCGGKEKKLDGRTTQSIFLCFNDCARVLWRKSERGEEVWLDGRAISAQRL